MILINVDSNKGFKEIPLDFLLDSESSESSESSSEDSSSVEVVSIIEVIQFDVGSASDEFEIKLFPDDTKVKVEIAGDDYEYDSDENGTCPSTTGTTEMPEEKLPEIPEIPAKQEVEDASVEPIDDAVEIIVPSVSIPDVYQVPKTDEKQNELDSNEINFNLIDSNDVESMRLKLISSESI